MSLECGGLTPLFSAATCRRNLEYRIGCNRLQPTKAASSRRTPKFPMSQRQYNSFADFWPHYIAEHSRPRTRLLHLVGTAIALGCVVYFIVVGKWWLFPLALIPGYGMAWIGHFFIEKNKPATFQHPLWSFMGDYKMIWMMLTGRIDSEVKSRGRAGVNPPSRP